MTKIKYINCFGTSFTAGGGFEFETEYKPRAEILKTLYGNIDETLTQYNFSYPGQIKKLLPDIEVNNYGKNGYGNDRVFRLAHDIISDSNFKKDEHIFLFEFGGLGRKEYWYNELNDFIILNYYIDWENKKLKDILYLANSWWYDSEELKSKLEKEESLFLEFYKKTFSFETEIKKYYRELDFFISFVESKKINYFLLSAFDESYSHKNFTYGDGVIFKKHNDFIRFSNINNLEIDKETLNQYIDKHNGYVSNKIVGQTIYNSLIDLGFLNYEKVNIDYKGLKNLKLSQRTII